MFIQRIEATGFGGAPRLDLALDRATLVDGPPRAITSLIDALLLAFAPWDRPALDHLLRRWRCREPAVLGTALHEGASWADAPGLAAVLAPESDGLLTVGLTLSLDPPQYGRLRKEAMRDPKVVDALAQGGLLHLKVGARFAPALDAFALDVLTCTVGEVSFPIAGPERPVWLTPFLASLAGKLHLGPATSEHWSRRASSFEAKDRLALDRACAALGRGPARLGEVLWLPSGPAVKTSTGLVPIHLYGPRVEGEAALLAAVELTGADILLVEDPPRAHRAWLQKQVEGTTSALEQVLLFGVPGGVTVG